MDDVIDLTAERNKREQPDADCMTKDEYGRTLYEFVCHYEVAGSLYSTTISAYDWDDAEAKVAGMRESITVSGILHSVVPA